MTNDCLATKPALSSVCITNYNKPSPPASHKHQLQENVRRRRRKDRDHFDIIENSDRSFYTGTPVREGRKGRGLHLYQEM